MNIGFNGKRTNNSGKATAQQVDNTTGKYVLKDLSATAEIFDLLSMSTQGVKGPMVIRFRSTYNGAIYTVKDFWQLRPAFPNEVQANARQGSDQFSEFWAANSHQYY